jgi:hypothetical protein
VTLPALACALYPAIVASLGDGWDGQEKREGGEQFQSHWFVPSLCVACGGKAYGVFSRLMETRRCKQGERKR